MRSAQPRRSSAAAATTIASTPSRPAALDPGRDVAAQPGEGEVGPHRASWARRRTEPVATTAPVPSSSSGAPTRASRASARSGTAPMTRPSGVTEGRSLAECTARSARPSSTAAWTSFTNTPLPPSSQIGTSRRRSPLGLDDDDLDVEPGVGLAQQRDDMVGLPPGERRAPGGDPELHRALTLVGARVTRGRTARAAPRRGARRGGVPAASLRPTVGWCSSLATSPRVSASTASSWRGRGRRAAPEPVELGAAHVLGPLAQGDDQRRHLAGGRSPPGSARARRRRSTRRRRPRGGARPRRPPRSAQVVHVEQRDAGQRRRPRGRRRGARRRRRPAAAGRPRAAMTGSTSGRLDQRRLGRRSR